MQLQTVTLIVAGMGIGGTLTAPIVGQLIAKSSQRKQWLRDKRLQDYQDVLSAVTTAYMAMIRVTILRLADAPLDDLREIENAKEAAYRVLRDRIFIADELESNRVLDEWDAAVTNFERTPDGTAFGLRFNLLSSTIVRIALQTPKGPSRLQRWRNRRAIARFRKEGRG